LKSVPKIASPEELAYNIHHGPRGILSHYSDFKHELDQKEVEECLTADEVAVVKLARYISEHKVEHHDKTPWWPLKRLKMF